MTFTTEAIARELAKHLSSRFQGVSFYEGPNQQGTNTPCMFLQQRYSNIKLQTGGRWIRTIGLDLTYLLDFNLPNLQQLYEAAAETLDLIMETFPYSEGDETARLRTYDREWRVDLDALHYKFQLKVRVSQPEEKTPMRVMDYREEVANG